MPRSHVAPHVAHLTQEQIIASSRQQARQEADPSYSGHSAGMHPEHRPYMSTELANASVTFDAARDYELEEDEAYYQTRLPTSARRYQVSPEEVYQSGNTRYHVRYVDVPKRKSRQHQLPPPHQQERYTDEVETAPPESTRRGKRRHPLFWFGIFCVLLILGWMGVNTVTAWYQNVQNDWTYGTKRHFEIDAVVGHGDSQTNPSHFTAENDNGQIIVIELPGGEVSHAKIYQIETVPGNAGNPPVKLSFQDLNGDGKPDMLVAIGGGNAMIYVTLFNNGRQFVSKL